MASILSQDSFLTVGFDDTDSRKGMCTTYLAFKIVKLVKKEKAKFVDYPKLIRFNPNIPWKTRGNGAVSLTFRTTDPANIKKKIANLVRKYSDIENGANPGLVFFENQNIPSDFRDFSKTALWKLIHRNTAKKFAKKNNLETYHLGNGQGLVGAIAAIGYEFEDNTVELLSYRKKSKFGQKRKISLQSVKEMQEKTYPETFSSFDIKKKKILIAPHGPDPVFFGLRGENAKTVCVASQSIDFEEKLEGHLIFRTNQGTGDHLKNFIDVNDLTPYTSGMIEGIISKSPIMNKGGYVTFSLLSKSFEINCIVYKPTGLSSVALELIKGDKIKVGGGVRKSTKKYPRVLNIEFIDVLELQDTIMLINPSCRKCAKKMKSKGKGQGFLCIYCKTHATKKIKQKIPRKLLKQQYLPDISAHRHLTRPLQRIGKSNKKIVFDQSIPWFLTY